ncbi:transposase, partial [Escherichia coli]|nr:transposase [Escherichia coli]EEX0938904.1 transposase [Escherichia coli]EFK5197794.1 transposase [Escherichia coli]EFN2008108.1 transposase [Escherichia coli]EGE6597457.1 transposase [Escherichia coli]
MKYVFIEKHHAEFSIKAMCSVVLAAFTRSKQRYDAARLTDELCAQGYHFNVKTVAANLRRQRLRAKASRKFSPVSYRAH